MTRSERDGVMECSGMLRGICMMLATDPDEDDEGDATDQVRTHLLGIANDLEAIAKGYDRSVS